MEFVSAAELPSVDTNFLDYEWEDNRGVSPLKWSELIGDDGEFSDEDDPTYEPKYQKLCKGNEYEDDSQDEDHVVDADRDTEQAGDFRLDDIDLEVEPSVEELEGTDFIDPESDDSDVEVIEARDRVKNCNSKIIEVALQLQKKASQDKLGENPLEKQAPTSANTTSQQEQPSQMASSATHASAATTIASSAHHTASALPTLLGRGGRMILGGQGARSSGRGRGRQVGGSQTAAAANWDLVRFAAHQSFLIFRSSRLVLTAIWSDVLQLELGTGHASLRAARHGTLVAWRAMCCAAYKPARKLARHGMSPPC
uniref:Uncharacterized protein n=1 Tax=Chenopodium quinoa TaxID=63459 RepID=A0A803L575_CHEQI